MRHAGKSASRGIHEGLGWMLLPGALLIFVFCYIPMPGVIMAFQNYSLAKGVLFSKFVGLRNFERFFSQPDIFRVVRNTVAISLMRLCVGFPVPIILALLLNEFRSERYKRTLQTIIYLPHFFSWVIVYALFSAVFSSTGALMKLIYAGNPPASILTNNGAIRWILVGTGIWKECGWGTIVYLSAMTGIDPELYEAAFMDGAGRVRRLWHITLPGISQTVVMLLILQLGNIMSSATDQTLLFLNVLVYEQGDIIGTYVYRMGLTKMEFSFSTAIGLFNSVIGLALVVGSNVASRRLVGRSLW